MTGGGALSEGIRSAAQRFTNPQAVADATIASKLGNDPAVAQALQNAPQYVAGESPSIAQVLQTPQAVQLERGLRNSPQTAAAFAAQDNANNAARLDVVQKLAGSPQDMADAIQARKGATQPFIDANLGPSQPAVRWGNAQ
jgi:hypothetical protein